MTTDADLLNLIDVLARQAGEAVMGVYAGTTIHSTAKADQSPLTAADLASHRVIAAGLAATGIPILSEEAAEGHATWAVRQGWTRAWVVDPLDGTKEFLKRSGEFTVNIALVERGVPILGAVLAPAVADAPMMWLGHVGVGAWKVARPGAPRVPIAVTDWRAAARLRVVASISHRDATTDAFLAGLPLHDMVAMGSSLKLCLVAEGSADIYPRFGPTMVWDTAAAQAVVEAAGGRVEIADGSLLRYHRENLLNPSFCVLGAPPFPWRKADPA